MADEDSVAVKTYVPPYQKERWREHADRLGMSQSEFVRTMVQAGRRDFEVPERPAAEPGSEEAGEAATSGLEPRVKELLDREDGRSWDELVEGLTEDTEDRLEAALDALQERNAVKHGRKGYVLTEDS
jgi:N-methylhydantoinase B/oxoprolinase/acetone carboxylase alpha subunit